MRQRRVFREWQHPRDDRGRFSRSGAGSWAKRAAVGFAKAEEGRVTPPAVAGRPRIGRNAKAGLILNQHQAGAGDALSKKWTPPPKLPPGTDMRNARDLGLGERRQVLHDGAWRTVVGTGFGGGTDRITVEVDNGERIDLPDTGAGFLSRPFRLELKEPLRAGQAPRMAAWQADAARPPQMRIRTNREENIETHRKELADAQVALKEAQRKARARANRKYPNKEGYGKWTRDQYIDSETWSEQSAVTWAERHLQGAAEPDGGTDTDKYLNKPGYRLPVLTGELNRDRPLAVYGDLMNIQDEDQATFRHLADLELIPAELHSIVARAMFNERSRSFTPERSRSAGVWLGSRPVPELNHSEDLATVQPRGWGDDKTWGHVDGAYRSNTRTMIVGVSESSQHRGEHGQPALHEFGHALDDAVGSLLMEGDPQAAPNASKDPAWVKLWRETLDAAPDISPYFRQMEKDAGAEEFWAEAFGEWSRARANARKHGFYTGAPDGGGEYLKTRGVMAMRSAFRIPKEGQGAAVALNAYFEGLVAKLGVNL